MQAVDHEVLRQASAWLDAGCACWFGTVVATWGSSPRPVGSLFACNADGDMVGSLSGGCVEDDLLEKLTAGQLASDRPTFFVYGETAEEAEKFGLPCGGHLDIVIEPWSPQPAVRAHVRHLGKRVAERRIVRRHLALATGAFGHEDRPEYEPLAWDPDARTLAQSFGPQRQLFIIGAGMVSRYLAEMAQTLDFEVTVCDPRAQLLQNFDVPGVQRIKDMPDDAVRARASDAASAIVALTHDPRIDDMGLMEALKTDACYIGAMGSLRTSENRRKRLKMLNLSDAEIDRLHAPVGLSIGSKTPPEIAIAILAEIISELASARAAKAQSPMASADLAIS